MNRLKEAMALLTGNDGPLPPEWLNHPLKGDWLGYRECHIGGDFLLIYKLDDSSKHGLVVFARSGNHSELFSSFDTLSSVAVLIPSRKIVTQG